MEIRHKKFIAAKKWVERRPLLAIFLCGLAFLFVALPQWLSAVWALISGQPLLPTVVKSINGVRIPFSPANWITIPVGVLGLVAVSYLLLAGKRKSYIVGVLFLLVIFAAVAVWWLWPIEIYPSFRSYKTELGNPIAKGRSAGPQPVEYVHEKAIVFWSEHLGFYKLRDDGYCEFEDDLVWRKAETPIWDNDEELNKLFPACNGKPPRLGVAAHWHYSPEKWQWIGCYVSDWRFFPDEVFFQEFEKRDPTQPGSCGKLIIGPLRTDSKLDISYIVVITDHAWYKERFNGPFPRAAYMSR